MLAQMGGWIVAAIGLLGTLAKYLYDRVTKRDALEHELRRDQLDHRQELTAADRLTLREEERDLVALLKADLSVLREELRLLREELRLLREDRVTDRALIASQGARLEATEVECRRLRLSRDHYRRLAITGERRLRATGAGLAADTLADEVSEADEATSQQRRAGDA